MEIKVVASTKLGYVCPTEDALELTGKMANICYTKRTAEDIFGEEADKSVARAGRTLASNHHSVAEHVKYSFAISGIPKILAMVLNNEGVYSTSEKSARYTEMKPTEREQEKYDKWLKIFSSRLYEKYGDKFLAYHAKADQPQKEVKTQITKLAQENARYMISVFTPTIMGHSLDTRQISYLCIWFERFVKSAEDTEFNKRLKAHMTEFIEQMKPYALPEIQDPKERSISLFDKRDNRNEFFDECYSTNYVGTFAQLAQAHRHRTLRYGMSFLEKPEFYVPFIIRDDELLTNEWLDDIKTLEDVFPQGMLVRINERGTYEDFIQKCSERLCGCAQLEIAIQSMGTLEKYLENVKERNEEVYNILLPYSKGARCMNGWKCVKPCVWGAKEAFTRKI